MQNLAEAIRQVPLFSGLSRENLARIVAKLQEHKHRPGDVIVRQGDDGDALYLLQSGAVDVVLENSGKRVDTLAVLGPGECFGEMALLTGDKRSASVVSLMDSVVWKLSKESWDDLIKDHPSLSLHLCKLLSRRLAETDRDISKGFGNFNAAMEEFFSAQPSDIQDFLIRTSLLKTVDFGAVQAVLSFRDPERLLHALSVSGNHAFLKSAETGRCEYREYLRDFLAGKLKAAISEHERAKLHFAFASYFLAQGQWLAGIHHYVEGKMWREAVTAMKAHRDELRQGDSWAELLQVLKRIPDEFIRRDSHMTELQAEAYDRVGDLDGAIHTYQNFLARRGSMKIEAVDLARLYQTLAELHQKRGAVSEALGCLQLSAKILQEESSNAGTVDALRTVELLQQQSSPQEAMALNRNVLNVAVKLKRAHKRVLWGWNKETSGILLAIAVTAGIWQIEPPPPLNANGIHFLAALAGGIVLWVFEVFDEYVTALLLLLTWLFFDIVSPKSAFSGFGQTSWFFVLGVFGIGAAVAKSGLLYRVSLQLLRHIPPDYKLYSLALACSGIIITPLFPEVKGRIAIMAPLTQTISEAMGYKSRSNGSAGLALSSFVGMSQLTFMFLTGASVCLTGWNLLPESAKSEFGWGTWFWTALPAGLINLVVLLALIHVFFPIGPEDWRRLSSETVTTQSQILGSLTRGEWVSIFVLLGAVIGWAGKPWHGVNETWVALGAFGIFLITGLLDKKAFRSNVDWGFLLFLGVVSALADIMPQLKIDRWLSGLIGPLFSSLSSSPAFFLSMVAILVYGLRLLLKKSTVVILLMVPLVPMASSVGIHPGLLLVVVLMAIEAWFLPYQTDSYQIAYYSTDEKAFSHAQARKLMVVKFIVSFVAIAACVPYWKMIGMIR